MSAGIQKMEIGNFRAETAEQIRAFRRVNSENNGLRPRLG
jgi:hypothetical protein